MYVVNPKKICKNMLSKYWMLEKARWQEVYPYCFLIFQSRRQLIWFIKKRIYMFSVKMYIFTSFLISLSILHVVMQGQKLRFNSICCLDIWNLESLEWSRHKLPSPTELLWIRIPSQVSVLIMGSRHGACLLLNRGLQLLASLLNYSKKSTTSSHGNQESPPFLLL